MLCGVSTVYICKPAGYSHTWSNSLKINLKSLSEVLLCAIFSARHWCRVETERLVTQRKLNNSMNVPWDYISCLVRVVPKWVEDNQ